MAENKIIYLESLGFINFSSLIIWKSTDLKAKEKLGQIKQQSTLRRDQKTMGLAYKVCDGIETSDKIWGLSFFPFLVVLVVRGWIFLLFFLLFDGILVGLNPQRIVAETTFIINLAPFSRSVFSRGKGRAVHLLCYNRLPSKLKIEIVHLSKLASFLLF